MDSANLHPEGQNVERILLVENQMGIHARPAAMIVRAANKFESDLFFEKDNEQVNGKSIMGLMMLAAGKGTELKAIAVGIDAESALEELARLFASKFDEK
jgi:phosphocarrier protein HPr